MLDKQDGKRLTVTRVAIVLMVVSIVIYSTITVIVYCYFQNELKNLQVTIEKLKTDSETPAQQQAPLTSIHCNCSNSVAGGTTGNLATNQTLLRCCSENQETLGKLITKIYQEKIQNRNLRTERNYLTLAQVERLVESVATRNRSQVTVSSGIGNVIPVAAHMTGSFDCFGYSEQIQKSNKHRHSKGKWLKVGHWDSSNGMSFTEYVPSDDYCMIVPKSGLYHVYSQAGFLDSRTTGHGHREDLNEYLHHTMLTNNGYSPYHTDLMKSVHIREGARAHVSSFHSGLFELREGDKIYMKVYLPSSEVQLDCSQESTYMGMYLVNDELSVYK
ncbi:tumor necrosis factor ligand superfamily member 10-like [Ptychodera flava]|uniref:tumor necrosis factor ligand superfamily member 10-like n=1 Tax=Ptychodera flava TaxID=63121 RepID=UPI00396A9C4E